MTALPASKIAKTQVLLGTFQRAVAALQSAVPPVAEIQTALLNVLWKQSAVQSAVAKPSKQQWLAVTHSTTALLSLIKKINVYVCTYAYVYRGNNRGLFKVLCPPALGVVS